MYNADCSQSVSVLIYRVYQFALLRHTDFTANFGEVIHTVYLQGKFYSVLMRAFPTALWKNDAVVNSIYML